MSNNLTAYTTAALVDAVIQLTHRIQDSSESESITGNTARTIDLRTQRDLARAELIRRTANEYGE